MANKIKYGIRNVYYSKITETDDSITYGTPVKLNGARSLDLSQSGDSSEWYADDIVYFATNANQGYEGDFNLALIPADFKKDILGEVEDSNGVLIENADAIASPFALMFEIQGNEKPQRTWLYYCTCSRPNVASSTKEASIEPQEETLSIRVLPRFTDHAVKATLTDSTSSHTVFEDFTSEVYEASVQSI